MGKKVVLIDGHSILNRAFYGVPELTNTKGIHTNAVYGFINILLKVLEEEKPECLTVAFDVKHPTFRHELYSEYKATRKPMPDELREQVPLVKGLLKAMGIGTIERPGYEADDVLGTIARKGEEEGYEVSVVSGDRDLLQLATKRIKVRIPKTKHGNTTVEDYYEGDVRERYQLDPLQIIDLKGLMGDASDNIPGVPGIGEKTATKILTAFHSVEEAIEHADEVTPVRAGKLLKEHKDLARLSKELATIKTDCELDFSFEKAKLGKLFTPEALEWVRRLEFKSLLGRFEAPSQGRQEMQGEYRRITNLQEWEEELAHFREAKPKRVGISSFAGKAAGEAITEDEGGQYSLFAANGQEEGEASENGLFGWSFAYQDGKGRVRAGYVTGRRKENDMPAKPGEALRQWIKEGVSISCSSLKKQLEYVGIQEDDKAFDAELAAYLINPLKDGYALDDLARDFLGCSLSSYVERFGKKDLREAAKEEGFLQYACHESQVALLAHPVLEEKLKDMGMWRLYEEVELPLVFALYEMESRGIGVHKEELKAYGERLGEGIRKLEGEIYRLVGETFNINSPKQLGSILFEKLNLPYAKKTKTGYSTSADVLEKLRDKEPVVNLVLEYRQLTKLKSTYADGLASYIDPEDGRIHGKFNQTITATGRISSTEPNLQNIPIRMELGREIRKVFIPKEGFVFLDADYSQIELRVLAHMSGDESLIQAYQEEQDIHRITAAKVFHTPLEEVTDEQRGKAKAVNFGIVYGISSFGLGQGLNITKKEAGEYIDKYFETYPSIKAFLDGLVADAKKAGYAVTMFGRRRPIPELASRNFMTRSFGERVAMNSPIQGTAADVIKIAMVRVNRKLKEAGLQSRLILQVHDELLVETQMDEVERVRKILHDEMFHAAKMEVPLEVEVKEGKNWYEAK